jgi:hypothetical protein
MGSERGGGGGGERERLMEPPPPHPRARSASGEGGGGVEGGGPRGRGEDWSTVDLSLDVHDEVHLSCVAVSARALGGAGALKMGGGDGGLKQIHVAEVLHNASPQDFERRYAPIPQPRTPNPKAQTRKISWCRLSRVHA